MDSIKYIGINISIPICNLVKKRFNLIKNRKKNLTKLNNKNFSYIIKKIMHYFF